MSFRGIFVPPFGLLLPPNVSLLIELMYRKNINEEEEEEEEERSIHRQQSITIRLSVGYQRDKCLLMLVAT